MKTLRATPVSFDSLKSRDFALLFDMDGVLIDESSSYRLAIQETVKVFSGKPVHPGKIQKLKEKGGYNNDWDLTEALLLSRQIQVPKAEIVKKFQELYLGANGNVGFIENEKWLLEKGTLESLHKLHPMGIVTGRPRYETRYILKKFEAEDDFDAVVVMEDYPPEKGKPDPFPVKLALERLGRKEAIYVGDSVDDVDAAKRAGILALGCMPPGVPSETLKKRLLQHGAVLVLDSIAQISSVVK